MRKTLASDILPLLEQGYTQEEVLQRVPGATKTYIRAVKSRMKSAEIEVLLEHEEAVLPRSYDKREPLPGNQLERAARLRAAGFSPFEILQVIPEVLGCLR